MTLVVRDTSHGFMTKTSLLFLNRIILNIYDAIKQQFYMYLPNPGRSIKHNLYGLKKTTKKAPKSVPSFCHCAAPYHMVSLGGGLTIFRHVLEYS